MKILTNLIRKKRAFALLVVLVFASLGVLLLTASLSYTSNTSLLNERSNQYNTTLLAAEAATEKVMSSMITDFKAYGLSGISANLTSYRAMTPTSGESSYWTNFTFSDAQGNISKTYVVSNGSQYFTADLGSTYSGLGGTRNPYRVISNAKMNSGRFNLTNAVQQEISFTTIPLFQFAIFYNNLMEYTKTATLTIRGRVHSNGSIYYGCSSASSLTFTEKVTAVGTIEKRAWVGMNLSDLTGAVTFEKGKETNAPTMSLPIGTNNTSAAVHKVIEQPEAGESITSAMGQERYYNKAQILILVSNSVVTIGVKNPFDATTNAIAWTNAQSFITTNKTFYDQREGKNQQVTEIDIALFNKFITTNSTISGKLGSTVPSLVYVADNRTRSGYGQAVRVINGQTLTNGLTIATPNGIYVKGHYNCPTSAGSTDTSNTKPASFVCDALTMLSSNWDDTKGANSYTTRGAAATTVNAAILTGNVPAGGSDGTSPRSGGVHNFPRLLEDWSGDILTINGSMVCMYTSTRATGNYITTGGVTGQYYEPPTRNWSFDNNFLDPAKLPPGTPSVRVLERMDWGTPPVNTVNYTIP